MGAILPHGGEHMKRIFKAKKPKNTKQYTLKGKENAIDKNTCWENFRDPVIERLFNTRRWKKLRDYTMMTNPICLLCKNKPAEELHHIVPVRKDFELFFITSNLAPLCFECHIKVTQAYRRGIKPDVLFPESRRLK